MRTLILLFTALFFTACTPTIHNVKESIDNSNYEHAMWYLKRIGPTPPEKFAMIYEGAVANYSTDKAIKLLDMAREKGANLEAKNSKNMSLMDYAQKRSDMTLIKFLTGESFIADTQNQSEPAKTVAQAQPEDKSLEKAQESSSTHEQNIAMQSTASYNTVSSDKDSFFIYGYQNNNIEYLDQLFAQGHTFSRIDEYLAKALRAKDYSWANYWLKHGADINKDATIFRSALLQEDEKLCNFLIDRGYDPSSDPTLLTDMIRKKDVKSMVFLMAIGYDPNSDPKLLSSVIKKEDYPLADYLIDNGADINKDPELFTYALNKEDLKMMKYLVNHGVAANFSAPALARALMKSNVPLTTFLIQKGVRLENGMTAATFMAFHHNLKMLKLLAQLKQDINRPDSHGRNALMYVADDKEITDWLIHEGANVNHKDRLGRSVLTYAASYPEVFEDLVSHGADIHAKDYMERSVLMYAVVQNRLPVIKTLIAHGVKVNEEDQFGYRALNFSKNMKLTRLLMKHKAHY